MERSWPHTDDLPQREPDAREIAQRWTEDQIPGWDVWFVLGIRLVMWSARPHGATTAPKPCTSLPDPDSLIEAVRRYESELAKHINETRQALEETDKTWHGRVDMLQRRLAALLVLQEKKKAST